MRVMFQLALCVCLIIVTAGTVSYVFEQPEIGGAILLLLVGGGLIALIASTGAFERPDKTDPNRQEMAERIDTLEEGLSNIQDIVIAIDDKLARQRIPSEVPADTREQRR